VFIMSPSPTAAPTFAYLGTDSGIVWTINLSTIAGVFLLLVIYMHFGSKTYMIDLNRRLNSRENRLRVSEEDSPVSEEERAYYSNMDETHL
jgi:hypothetical protein